MWPPTITPCECTEPGYCSRHQCVKGYWEHRLCRRQRSVFDAYEAGEGPGQQQNVSVEVIGQSTSIQADGPGLIQRGLNFAAAGVRHIANGMQTVADDIYEARLTVCRSCDLCDQDHMVCLQPKCGCFLNVKARWASENCPLGKWSSVLNTSSGID